MPTPVTSTIKPISSRLPALFVAFALAIIPTSSIPAAETSAPLPIEPRVIPLWPANSRNASPGGAAPTLEIFYPFTASVLPATVVIFPGGGYAGLSAYERRQAEYFRALGYTAVVVNYRVQPHRHPAAYADAMRALRLLRHHRAEWSLPAGELILLGGSAGGHLAALVTTRPDLPADPDDDLAGQVSTRPDRLILLYPVILTTGPAAHVSIDRLLGPDAPVALKESLSPDRFVGKSLPPVLLFHAADDTGVPVENSLAFARACWAVGVPAELHVFPRGGHGKAFAYDPEVGPRWREIMQRWLQSPR